MFMEEDDDPKKGRRRPRTGEVADSLINLTDLLAASGLLSAGVEEMRELAELIRTL